ncbi:MAG: hypothetical protein OS130_10160 [Thermodesulfobacteriota bacterium]|jgi:hypothetical protein|nr:MAG: hypothetical protein OS130_10160 [Thermodesulfobacteriota bacterium]
MVKRFGILVIIVAAIAVFSGCACQKDLSAENWGRSFELAKYNQYLNPEAGKNLEPVEGLNGWAADAVMAGYQESFKGGGKGPQSVNLNLGSISGIGQAKQ